MKRTIRKLLIILATLFISVGSTVAYLTDVDKEVNIMTLDRVEIDLIEQERTTSGALTNFQDNHPLYPGYYPQGLNIFDEDGYWVGVHNTVDKIVTVKNTGKAPAYVRLWFAFEITGDVGFFDEKIHLNRNATDWQWVFLKNTDGSYAVLKQNGTYYVVATATYSKVLPANSTAPVSLRQVLLDSSATNDDLLKLGDKYSILVVAQGMQSAGFDSSWEALTEGFGVPSLMTNPFAGMKEEDADVPVPAPSDKNYGEANRDGVPVLMKPMADATVLFTIDKGYEFEIVDFIIENSMVAWLKILCVNPTDISAYSAYVAWSDINFGIIPDNNEKEDSSTHTCIFEKTEKYAQAANPEYHIRIYAICPVCGKQDRQSEVHIYDLTGKCVCGALKAETTPNPESDFEWEKTADGKGIIITNYIGNDANVVISSTINGLPVVKLDHGAFNFCTCLKSIYIPRSVISIDSQTFYECRNLTDLQIAADNPSYTAIDSVVYTKDMKSLLWCPPGKTGTLTIPEGVETIEVHAVESCWELSSVISPESLQVIEPWAFSNCTSLKSVVIPGKNTLIEIDAFAYCTSLSEIQVTSNNQHLTTVDGVLFTKDMKTLLTCPGAKKGAYTIPDGVTKIEEYAFSYCSGLTEINIPNSVTTIVYCAFDGCSNLQTIVLPDSLTELQHSLFMNCTRLSSVTVPPSITSIDDSAFWGTESSALTVYCEKGSAAHKFCIENDIPFKLITF